MTDDKLAAPTFEVGPAWQGVIQYNGGSAEHYYYISKRNRKQKRRGI